MICHVSCLVVILPSLTSSFEDLKEFCLINPRLVKNFGDPGPGIAELWLQRGAKKTTAIDNDVAVSSAGAGVFLRRATLTPFGRLATLLPMSIALTASSSTASGSSSSAELPVRGWKDRFRHQQTRTTRGEPTHRPRVPPHGRWAASANQSRQMQQASTVVETAYGVLLCGVASGWF